jgi:hypothetical protein
MNLFGHEIWQQEALLLLDVALARENTQFVQLLHAF